MSYPSSCDQQFCPFCFVRLFRFVLFCLFVCLFVFHVGRYHLHVCNVCHKPGVRLPSIVSYLQGTVWKGRVYTNKTNQIQSRQTANYLSC